MVFVVVKEQPSKKSKLNNLFRLGKSSKSNSHDNAPPASARQVNTSSARSISHPGLDSPPATLPRGARKTWQDARRVQSESRERPGFAFPAEHDVDLTSEFSDDSGPDFVTGSPRQQQQQQQQQQQHERSSSLPIDQLLNSTSTRTISPHVLSRIETSDGVLGRHARQRSHFSIPDVVITACEEDGEEVHVEIEIPPEKRRSYVFAKPPAASQQPDRSAKKASAKAQRKKPTPLIDLGQEMAQGLATSSSAGSVEGMAAAHQGSPPRAVASTTSSASSTMSKGTASPPSKRTRKSSFPLLFGRKSLDSSRAAAAAAPSQPGPMPMTPCSPTATYGEQHVVYSTHYESSTSLPSSSRESLPGGPPNRGQLFNPSTALPSPPETPVLATRPLSKKELKAREKEEMALIRELEKIDKMVREHDNKARKAAERAHAKEQKRAAAADKQQQQPQAATKRASNAFKRITIFSAASKAGPAVSVGRRGSVMRKRETLVSEDGRAKAPVSAGSVTSPKEGRFQFPMPPSTPPTPRRGTPDSPGKGARPPPVVVVTDAEDESVRGPASPAARSDGQKDSEELDQSTWRSQDWADLDPRRSSTFTSLIKRNELSSGSTRPAAPPSSYRFAAAIDEDEEDAAGDGEERSGFSPKLSKRGSVQRALAMADAEETMLRKRSSIRRRGDRSPQPQSPPLQGPQSPQLQQQHQPQQQKRSSRRLNSSGGLSSKRSSVASDTRRRSLIRQLDAFEGWEVADQPELERQTSLDMANWVDSLDGPSQEQGDGDDGVDFPLPSTASAMMQEMLHVDRVLKDLQAAQAAQAADGSSSAAGSTSSGGSSEAKLAATPRSSARELDGSLDDGQSTPRASVAGISRPNIPTISFTPASVDSGLDQIGALGSPIPTDRASGMPSRDRSARFSRPTKSDKRRDSNPASPTSPRSPVHARPADAEVRCAGSPPTTSSSSSSCASTSSTASSPTTSATTTFSSTASSPVSPSRKAEFRISMAPFQPIDLFGVDVDGIVGTADDI